MCIFSTNHTLEFKSKVLKITLEPVSMWDWQLLEIRIFKYERGDSYFQLVGYLFSGYKNCILSFGILTSTLPTQKLYTLVILGGLESFVFPGPTGNLETKL